MIGAIIFDLDGVLISTDEYHYKAWKEIADTEGIPFSKSINNRLRGVSRMDSLNIILEKANHPYSLKEKEVLCEKKNAIYRKSLEALSPVSVDPTVVATLKALLLKKIPLAIGSSSKNAPLIVDRIGLRPYFQVIVDGSMISHSKPDPEVFLLAGEKLHYEGKAMVVEDSEAGIIAAHNGGFIPVAIKDARNCPLAQKKISSLEELIPLVKEY